MKQNKICEICKKAFSPVKIANKPRTRVSHKYCSQKCKKEGKKKYSRKYNKIYQKSGKALEAGRKYRKSDKGKEALKKRRNSLEFKENQRRYLRKLYSTSKEYKEKKRKFYKEYYGSEIGKQWKREYRKNKRKTDPIFKLQETMRTRLGHFLKAKKIKKTNKTFLMIGCTPEFLKEYLERQFYPNPRTNEKMTWKNHKFNGWHIDHIKPLDLAKTYEEMKKLSHYSNLQPMWAEENLKKSNKIL